MKNNKYNNLNLLKIICIIGIIYHHYIMHGGIIYNIDNLNSFSKIIIFIGKNIGKTCSNAFVIITGFFMFKSKFKIEKIIKIIGQFIFYSVLINILLAITLNRNEFYNDIIYSFFPISFSIHWFPTAYIGMYMLLPFLKKAFKRFSKENYLTILCILGIFISAFPSLLSIFLSFIFKTDINNEPYGGIITLIFIALIGGYISKFNILIFKRKIYDIISIIVLLVVGGLLNCSLNNNSIFSIFEAILFLDLFLKINLNNNKIIDLLSSSSLAILLLSDNSIFNTTIWSNIFNTQNYYYKPPYILLLHIIKCALIIISFSTLIDCIRRFIVKITINKKIDNINIVKKVNNILE